jgi:RNA polymerase sigma-70 factor (ECF subfamily)
MADLEELCRRYRLPVYAFIRKRGHAPEEADDLTQEFFARLVESDFLNKADRSRGRFRCFLMTSIDNFLRVEHRNATARKRGGGWRRIDLDVNQTEHLLLNELADNATPELAFERQWAKTLLNTVLEQLERDYAAGGRRPLFQALKPHLRADADALPYAQIAARLGVSLTGVKVSVHRARQRFQECLRAEIAKIVTNQADVDDEIRHLLNLLS